LYAVLVPLYFKDSQEVKIQQKENLNK